MRAKLLHPQHKPLVYISSPYSIGDKERNVIDSLSVASVLRDSGKVIPFAPLLTHYWDLHFPAPYDTWLAMDLDWVRRCDALLRLPGLSSGADIEEARARYWGKEIFHNVDELLDWADTVSKSCPGLVWFDETSSLGVTNED